MEYKTKQMFADVKDAVNKIGKKCGSEGSIKLFN